MLNKCFLCFFVMFSLFVQNLNAQDFAISVADSDQLYPDVAFDGTNFWTVWADKRSGTFQIYGARITPNGVLLDTNGILLASLPDTGYTMPSVAFGDSAGCVAFNIDIDIDTIKPSGSAFKNAGVLRFYKNGNIMDSIPKFVSGYKLGNFDYLNCIGVPTVIYGKNHFFLFINSEWQYIFEGGYDGSILALTDSAFSTQFADKAFFGINSMNIGNALTGIWNGEKMLGVWDCGYSSVVGRFFEDSLYYDTTGLDTFKINDMSSYGYSDKPRELAFSGSRYLLISEKYNEIWYTILSDSGKPIDSLPTIINNGGSAQSWPACTYSDGKFIAVWQGTNLYGAIIDTFGAIIDSGYINCSSVSKITPSLATGAGKTLLVWADHRTGDFNIYGSFMSPDSIGIEESSNIKTQNANIQISQNPFIKSTVIKYCIPVRTQVILSVYDISGSCIKTLVNEEKPAGSHNITLNANELKTGIYFVRLTAGTFKTTKKLILMK
ncbi:MAG: T9SS type A sorting domain-containing protein [bacterium]|nr:T9SS type A sorting domain-containing protein [bacterium]